MAEYDVKNEVAERIVTVRMSGMWTEADVDAFFQLYQRRVHYHGRRHMVIADMRGMKPMQPAIAEKLGALIGLTRREGAVLCAHLSDHTVQRLQLARVARENSAADGITVDVANFEEALRVLAEARARLDDARYTGSIRDPILAR